MSLEYHDKVYTKKCPCGNVITITGIATTDEDGHHTTNYRVDGSTTGLDKFCRVICTCWKVYNASAAIGRYHAKERIAHQETPAPVDDQPKPYYIECRHEPTPQPTKREESIDPDIARMAEGMPQRDADPLPEYAMVATEAGTQYSFDVAPDTQLALF
jgi:hypothetical protein